jgi:rare lipoprotein A
VTRRLQRFLRGVCALLPSVLSLLLVAAALLPALLPSRAAAAPTATQLQKRVGEANKRIAGEQRTLEQALQAYAKASRELRAAQSSVRKNEKRLKKLDASIGKNRKLLNQRADYLYRSSGVGFLETLLASRTLDDFTDTVVLLNYVAQDDAALLKTLQEESAQREATQADLRKELKRSEAVAAARKADVARAQKGVDAAQAWADTLDDEINTALERERAAANARAAASAKPAPGGGADGGGATGGGSGESAKGKYEATGVTFTGLATWYGVGTGTASGERFNPEAMTCAHKTLPFGTWVRVTYKGKSVTVRVNDRGPYGKGRVIDLTRRAAEIIGLKRAGVGKVTCEIVARAD